MDYKHSVLCLPVLAREPKYQVTFIPDGLSVSAVSVGLDPPGTIDDKGDVYVGLLPGEGVTLTVTLTDGDDIIDCNTVTVIPTCGKFIALNVSRCLFYFQP